MPSSDTTLRYRVRHVTQYRYSDTVEISQSALWLTPRQTPWQTVRSTRIDVSPRPDVLTTRQDYFANVASYIHVQERHEQVTVLATSEIDLRPPTYPEPQTTPAWESVVEALTSAEACRMPGGIDAMQHRFDSRFVRVSEVLRVYAAVSFTPGRPVLAALLDLTRRIHKEFRYDPASTTVATPIEQVFAERAGVCQDFAHLQIAMLRSLGLAARYVSGYLYNQPPPGKQKLVGADASHAWISLFVPGIGWIDADPTNNTLPHEHHVTIAWGRDYADVTPMRGVILGGGAHEVTVAVDVARVPTPAHHDHTTMHAQGN
jgi:transglutaminase-like putative cysteine protease